MTADRRRSDRRRSDHRRRPGDRFPTVEGALGPRDLGGLPAAGGHTRLGRVFAGGRRELMTARGVEQLAGLGVRSIIDLRTAAEVGRRDSDPAVPEAAWQDFEILACPVEDFDNAAYVVAIDHPFLNHPKQYGLLLEHFPGLLHDALVRLAEAIEAGPVYIHCSAGRDRTGLVSAWMLQLAGVDPKVIGTEYVRSLAVVNEHHKTSGHPVEYFMRPREFAAWTGERHAALLDFLSAHPAAAALEELRISSAHAAALATLRP